MLDGADVVRTRQGPQIENLVFRGGGVKGIAYCGALRVLTDLNLLTNVKRYPFIFYYYFAFFHFSFGLFRIFAFSKFKMLTSNFQIFG